ncbi:MAG: DUF5054 domain-containing protein [Kluyvera sp.]|uniref:DUF5054 domain-containing protein n=1 Tax=Kluyvera sp. TaxID=1538228 RepID=UPI003A88E7C8
MQRVHIIYKTHLDIGFTDYAQAIEDKYLTDFIPAVVNLARQVNAGEEKNFIWTCGSWLIHRYLQRAAPADCTRLYDAIAAGDIVWHGLPFTTHSELLTPTLMQHALSYRKNLDQRFHSRTIAAKMTDVPGHPQAIVPWLAEAGLRYLHLGVNAASCPPDVPPLFIWKYGQHEIVVNYSFGGYGNATWCEALDELLVFCHAEDNCSPPTAAEVMRLIERYRQRYPEARVSASTLDAFAARVETIRHTLPIVEAEIGDTWNHGLATDPGKVSRYRRLNRRLQQEIVCPPAALDALLMVPEHTWGMDLKLHLPDYCHYLPEAFSAARARERVTSPVPLKYDSLQQFIAQSPHKSARSYRHFSQSWEEQRRYIDSACAQLPAPLCDTTGAGPVVVKGMATDLRQFSFGDYEFALASDGSLSALNIHGRPMLDAPFASLIYRQIGPQEYDRFRDRYLQNLDVTSPWALSDFTKPGLELTPRPVTTQQVKFSLKEVRFRGELDAWYVQAIIQPNNAPGLELRLPSEIVLEYGFSKIRHALSLRLSIYGKQANRLPEEIWLQLGLANVGQSTCQKLGYPIDWFNVVSNGNHNLHAVELALTEQWTLEPLDAPLLGLYQPRILCFGEPLPPRVSLYGQLYNNVWGTNFPMWYEDDIHAEYRVYFSQRGE